MGIVSRHANSPFANGETLAAADLEADFNTIYQEYNGNTDNQNIASGAAIVGTKLAATTLTSNLFVADTLTLSKMDAATVPKHHVATDTSYGVLPTSQATLTDWVGLTSATLTPGSVNDMIMMDISFHYNAAVSDSNDIILGWSIDAVEKDSVLASQPISGNGEVTVHSSYSIIAPDTDSMIIKPMWRYNGTRTITVGHLQFRCFILPGKA